MTKKELKKEAEEKANKVIIGSGMNRASVIHLKHLLTTFYIQGYHTGAEPREKRIAELEAQIEVTAKSKDLVINNQLEETNMLKEKIKQLEAQIEKMKCCENCVLLKEKTYQICHDIKKKGSKKCAFYKMI